MRVEILTDWPDDLAPGASVHVEGDDVPVTIERVERGGRVPVLYFAGSETRESVESLTGRYLEAPAHALEEGSYFWSDLIGLRVEDTGGGLVGELVEIFRAGGNEVYRVVGPAGERLVPALRSTVLDIDLRRRRIVIAPDDAETVG